MKRTIKKRFKKQIELTDREEKVLESLRFQDSDFSQKLGSTLAFSGLMIATSIVLLSTSEDAIMHIGKTDLFLLTLNSIGLFLLYISGIISILSLISTTEYTNNTELALIEYDEYLKKKKKKLMVSSRLLVAGTTSIMGSLVIILLSNILH
ncbi:MAG: hypothetical protein JKY08_08540 [Flavobacteriaceae bacterium]|nr:hypothetical protein [Flavobacteriaceae bacterium]